MKTKIYIDSSALSKAACNQRLVYTIVNGYREAKKKIDIEYGVAFHKFAEHLERTNGDENAAIRIAQDHLQNCDAIIEKSKEHLNVGHLTVTCMTFASHWKQSKAKCVRVQGEPLVEVNFKIPWSAVGDYEFILSGTIDRFVRVGTNGAFLINDYKTTSAYNKNAYFDSYLLSKQLMIYAIATRYYALRDPESIFAQMWQTKLGAAIEGIFLKPSPSETLIERSPVVYFKESVLDELSAMITCKCHEIAAQLSTGTVTRNGLLSDACTSGKFGMCEFFSACAAPDEVSREFIIKNKFITKQYDPSKFHE